MEWSEEQRAAMRDIDTVTFCRIRQAGFENLTQNQRDLILQALDEQVKFRADFVEMLGNPLSSFGINGVSMSWDNKKVSNSQGVYMQSGTLALLTQTGLCCRVLS